MQNLGKNPVISYILGKYCQIEHFWDKIPENAIQQTVIFTAPKFSAQSNAQLNNTPKQK